MLLNGWKDISRYLQCGVGTAQRWQRDSHLPIMRSAPRGRVVAETGNLDDWLRRREVAARLTARTAALQRSTTEASRTFLWTELSTGREFARLAVSSNDSRGTLRRTQAARVAYNTLLRVSSRKLCLPKAELKRFKGALKVFKHELQELGEKF